MCQAHKEFLESVTHRATPGYKGQLRIATECRMGHPNGSAFVDQEQAVFGRKPCSLLCDKVTLLLGVVG